MNAWIEQWFGAGQATNGGVIRRNRDDIDEYASLDEVIVEASQRGWHVIETGNQIVVLCHPGTLHIYA
jgi:hypothetical protein